MSAQRPLKHLEGLEMARYMYSVCSLGLTLWVHIAKKVVVLVDVVDVVLVDSILQMDK